MTDRIRARRAWVLSVLGITVAAALFIALGGPKALVRTSRVLMRGVEGESPEVPVIEAGREKEVMALFQQHPLASTPIAGWRFMQISIQARSIYVQVNGPNGRTSSMTLRHPDDVGRAETRSPSFVVLRTRGDPEGDAVLDLLISDLRTNDNGHFWKTRASVLVDSPDLVRAGPVARSLSALQDGVVVSALILAVLAMLLARSLRDEPKETFAWLLLAGAVGAAYRASISIPTTMDVWPYSRLLAMPRMLFESRILGWITAKLGTRIYLNELILQYDFATSFLAPFAVFVHAKALLRDRRAALWASALIITLPSHIRFSHSDSGFIPSAVFASMTFALVSQSLRDPSRTYRVLASVCVPWMMILTMEQRILNAMFPLLYLVQIWFLQPREIPNSRRFIASVIVVLTLLVFLLGGFLERNNGAIQEGLQLRTLITGITGLVRPHFNTLIHPGITPPLYLLAMIAGLVTLWREGKQRWTVFLIVWPAMFYFANSLIRPSTVEMQSRYHLHLAAPFVLAGGYGIRTLLDALPNWKWSQRISQRTAVLTLFVVMAITPLLHLAYERRTDFNDIREYDFIRRWRDKIPQGCVVLEHFGPENPYELRFGRMGRVLDSGQIRQAFHSVLLTSGTINKANPNAPPTKPQDPIRSEVRAIFADPPDCVMYFQNMACLGQKEDHEPIAPACSTTLESAPFELLERIQFPNRPYDEAVSRSIVFQPERLIDIALYRLRVEDIRARAHPQP